MYGVLRCPFCGTAPSVTVEKTEKSNSLVYTATITCLNCGAARVEATVEVCTSGVSLSYSDAAEQQAVNKAKKVWNRRDTQHPLPDTTSWKGWAEGFARHLNSVTSELASASAFGASRHLLKQYRDFCASQPEEKSED